MAVSNLNEFTLSVIPGIQTKFQLYYPGNKIPDAPRTHLHSNFADSRQFSRTPPALPTPSMIFTHGKGSQLENVAIINFLRGYSKHLPVLAFEQADEDEILRVALFRAILAQYPGYNGAFGGRSMGSRCGVKASYFTHVKRHIFFAYPLHRDMNIRYDDLLNLPSDTEVLFISGTKDPMCVQPIMNKCRSMMAAKSWFLKVKDMDHAMWCDGSKKYRNKYCHDMGEKAALWLQDHDEKNTEAALDGNEKTEVIKFTNWAPRSPVKEGKPANLEISLNGRNLFGFQVPNTGF